MLKFAQLSLLCLSIALVSAGNDWAKPCFSGECAYELPKTSDNAPSGLVKIAGSTRAITDITEAAGWVIMDCDPDAIEQDIRIVCKTSNGTEAGCDHLELGGAVVGKIVRLPDSCGAGPFARIAAHSLAEDQSIPSNIRRSLSHARSETPEVKALTLDTKFDQVDPGSNGPVAFALQGTNVPNDPSTELKSSSVSSASSPVFVDNVAQRFSQFNKSITAKLPPVEVTKNDVTIIDESISCPAIFNIPAYTGSVKASVDVDVKTQITIGLAVSGTIIPPEIDHFVLFSGIDSKIKGNINVKASVGGTLAASQQVAVIGIPGLSFPGLITLGPTLAVNLGASIHSELDTEFTYGVDYDIDSAKVFFPSNPDDPSQSSAGTFTPNNMPYKVQTPSGASSNSTVSADIAPEVNFGLNAFDGLVKSQVYLDLFAGTTLGLTVGGNNAAGTRDTKTSACTNLNTQLNVNAGARGAFFSIFNNSTQIPLWNTGYEVFKACEDLEAPLSGENSKRTLQNSQAVESPISGVPRDRNFSVRHISTPSLICLAIDSALEIAAMGNMPPNPPNYPAKPPPPPPPPKSDP